MKPTKLFFLLLALLPIAAFGQTSILGDKSGETSILLNDKKSIFINAGDGSVSANISFNKPKWFIGANTKFKSTEGISMLLDGYKFKPEFDFGFFSGNTVKSIKESVIQYIYYGVKFNTSNFNLLNNDSSNTFQDKTFYGGTLHFGYNRIGAINIFMQDGLASSYLFGVSIDYSQINNLDDLKSVQTSTTFTTDTGKTTTILVSDKKSGFSGNYSNFSAFRFNIDAYIYPQIIGGQIGFGGYSRSQFSGTDPRTTAGVGFIIGKKGAPTNVIFGILYQFNDLFNQLKEENNFLKRGGINIVAGYSF
jgi:hypothetical protein